MRNTRVYIDAEIICDTPLHLPEPQAHHLGRVLRLRVGQFVDLFNGRGGCYQAEISSVHKHELVVMPRVYLADEPQARLGIYLAQGISRGRHMDYTIQKAVELGAAGIIPLVTERSNVRISAQRRDNKLSHWRSIIIGACEQCGRNTLPELAAPVNFHDWINTPCPALKIILDPHAAASLSTMARPAADVTIISGPEGGFSDHELTMAGDNDCIPVRLGPRILRTETAALAALSACQALWGDMG